MCPSLPCYACVPVYPAMFLCLSQSTLLCFCVCPSLLCLCMCPSLPCNVCLNVVASQLKVCVSTTSIQIRVCANSHSSRTQHAVFALPYGASFSLASPSEATVIQSQRLITYRDMPGCCSRQYWSCCCHLNTVWLHDLMAAGWCRCGFR